VAYNDFVAAGSLGAAREKGLVSFLAKCLVDIDFYKCDLMIAHLVFCTNMI
jgi:hypothetical protein